MGRETWLPGTVFQPALTATTHHHASWEYMSQQMSDNITYMLAQVAETVAVIYFDCHDGLNPGVTMVLSSIHCWLS